jgi:predicted TPR repeat methyltransferase
MLGTQAAYTRLMDRFYVPISPSTAVVSALFDLIAELYDELIGYSTNLETARQLITLVLQGAPASARILDFGCGTGIARVALKDMSADAHIIGTDISTEMLRRAVSRGEEVLTLEQWRKGSQAYEGAIACFVLHYGVPDSDLVRIAKNLVPGGRFAANLFKASQNDIERLTRLLGQAGLQLVETVASMTVSENPILVFERPTC